MRVRATMLALAMPVMLGGCEEGATEPTFGTTATMTVDASSDTAFVQLGDPAESVEVADASASAAWDLGFHATTVVLNDGTEGPGEVEAFCVCQNASATDAEVIAMTAEEELAAFEAVTAADLPSASAWGGTTVFASSDAGRKWYRYNLEGTHLIYPTYNVYLVRAGGEVYKVQLVSYYGSDGTTRQITFRYALLES